VVVEGDAGIGKTRLVETFTAAAAMKGARVLVGCCPPLVEDLPYAPVLTVRGDELAPGHPLAGVLAELGRSKRSERLRLAPLTRAEVERQVAVILDRRPGPELVQALYRRGEGNPFFTEELLAVGPDGDRLPATVRDVVLARLARLGLVGSGSRGPRRSSAAPPTTACSPKSPPSRWTSGSPRPWSTRCWCRSGTATASAMNWCGRRSTRACCQASAPGCMAWWRRPCRPDRPPSPERAQVLAAMAQSLMLRARPDEAVAYAREAIEVARLLGSTAVLAHASNTLGASLCFLGRTSEGLALLREALATASDAGDPAEIGRVRFNLTGALAAAGRLEEALAQAREGAWLARQLGQTGMYAPAIDSGAVQAPVRLGRLGEAAALATSMRSPSRSAPSRCARSSSRPRTPVASAAAGTGTPGLATPTASWPGPSSSSPRSRPRRRAPTPDQLAYALLARAERSRLDSVPAPSLWAELVSDRDTAQDPYLAAYARWRHAEALLAGRAPRSRAAPLLLEARRLAAELAGEPQVPTEPAGPDGPGRGSA
jgi:tetratricopeptide (TPR) repeat protein